MISVDNVIIDAPSQGQLIKIGDWVQASARVTPSNASCPTINWSSNRTSVATVTADGQIYAKGIGSAQIYARSTDGTGRAAFVTINVIERGSNDPPVTTPTFVQSISITPINQSVRLGGSCCYNASVLPQNATNKSIGWQVTDTNVATINSSSGIVTPKKVGQTSVFAVAEDGSGIRAQAQLTVLYANPVTGISLSSTPTSLNLGTETPITVSVTPSNADHQNISWISRNTNIVSIVRNDEEGKNITLKANNIGKATIDVYTTDGSDIEISFEVTVKQNTTIPSDTTEESDSSDNRKVADPIDIYTGAHTLSNKLISLHGGLDINFTANYDSLKLASGCMGKGWYHNFEKHIEFVDDVAHVYSSPSSYSRYNLNSNGTYSCAAPNKNGYTLTVDETQEYPYTIDCNQQQTEYYNSNGKLAKIVNRHGFETIITYADRLITITDGLTGKSLYLDITTDGKLEQVYDTVDGLQHRTVKLTYENDLLTEITNPNNNVLQYTYNNDGQILTGTDGNGICYFTNVYDDYGRVMQQKDGIDGSAQTKISYWADGKRVWTDRNGYVSYRWFDNRGLLTKYTDPNGITSTYTYDSRYNMIRETDGNDNSTYKYYNSFNKPTYIKDKNGNITNFTYDSKGNVTEISYPEIDGIIPIESFTYNERNQLTQHTDLRGTVTVYTYDENGMPASKKAGLKNVETFSYIGGYLRTKTTPCGLSLNYSYDKVGRLSYKNDFKEKETAYTYDKCDNIIEIVDGESNTTQYTYDCNNQLSTVTLPGQRTTEYIYNGNMKKEVEILPDNNSITYEYDGEDRLTKVIDQLGNITETQYDKAGRVVAKIFPDGSHIDYAYDAVGNVIKETNQKGAITQKTYDAMGNVLSVTDNDGNITMYQYNAMYKIIRKINTISGTTLYKYSPAGDLLSETDALGNKKTYTYDEYGNLLTETDARGNTTTYTYDDQDNICSKTDALGNITTYIPSEHNDIQAVIDANGNKTNYFYDGMGRLTIVLDPNAYPTVTRYNRIGQIYDIADSYGKTLSTRTYNKLGLLETDTNALNQITNYTYNEIGKLKTVTDPLGNMQEYSYDSLGRNTSVKDALENSSSAEYDVLGNITKLTGPRGGSTSYTYDTMGRLTSETTASNGIIEYGYNHFNVKSQVTNARGHIRKYFYDVLGRIIGYIGAEDTVSYTYDENGNVLTVTDKSGTITREYDALNRVTKYTDASGNSIGYEYDPVGNLSKLIYPDNTAVTYTYNNNNLIETVTDWDGRVTRYEYDKNKKLIKTTNPDGSIVDNTYDDAQRIISSITKTTLGETITGFEYVYDDNGRIDTEKHLADNIKICYTYDELNRVTKKATCQLDDTLISEENYSYDSAGNITSAPTGNYNEYDINNRLIKFNNLNVDYDADGNMLSCYIDNACQTFEYDSANRLIKSDYIDYVYDAEDVRIKTLSYTVPTTYIYNTNCKLSQLLYKKDNYSITKYVYGIGLIGEQRDEWYKIYHFDYRGSTVALTNICGMVTDTFKYDAYGNMTSRTGVTPIIFGYNGRDGVVTDANGLIYMRARYYSPILRRFINADIIHGEISSAVTLNRYAYANGNPVSFVDPFGLSAEKRFEEDSHTRDILHTIDDIIKGSYTAYKGFRIERRIINGVEKIIIFGPNDLLNPDNIDIAQRIINADNLSKYPNIQKYLSSKTAVKDALSNYADVFTGTAKNAFDYLGVAGDIIFIGADTIIEANKYEDWEDKIIVGGYTAVAGATSAVASTVTAAATSAVITSVATKVGGTLGTAIAPGLGTAIGAVVGFGVGFLIGKAFDWGKDKYIDEWVNNN